VSEAAFASGLKLLRLLQLADSALPIGGLTHSFGLETLIEEGELEKNDLFPFFQVLLCENLLLDAVYCRKAHSGERVGALNERLNALRLARELREGSISLGRRFLIHVANLEEEIAACAEDSHFVVAFGYVSGALGFNAEDTVSAFLHQSITAALSVCQRLLRLGQREAAQIAWDLKPFILDTVARSATLSVETVGTFAHLPELASMRHPTLPTRLFVS
jgi:urease accessory protein